MVALVAGIDVFGASSNQSRGWPERVRDIVTGRAGRLAVAPGAEEILSARSAQECREAR